MLRNAVRSAGIAPQDCMAAAHAAIPNARSFFVFMSDCSLFAYFPKKLFPASYRAESPISNASSPPRMMSAYFRTREPYGLPLSRTDLT